MSTSVGPGWLSVGNDVDENGRPPSRANDITPFQFFSCLGGFAVRTDWRSSDLSTARRHPTSHPPEARGRC
jgi:hypothetical protein